MSSANIKLEDDLEEGEIKDDVFENISECSLSEALVMQEDLKSDSDIELLREEALKSLRDEETTEEYLYRLEALESLLMNIESSEIIPAAKKVRKKKRKGKKKFKRKTSSKFVEIAEIKSEAPEVPYVSSDALNLAAQIDNSLQNICFSDKENQIAGHNKLSTRSWYPKSKLALLSPCSKEIPSKMKRDQPTKQWDGNDFIIIPKILSASENEVKLISHEPVLTRKPVNRYMKVNHCTAPVTPVPVAVSKSIHPVPPLAVHLSRFQKISRHRIRKYHSSTFPMSKFAVQNIRNGRYKIVNKPCYVLKKSTNPPLTTNSPPPMAKKPILTNLRKSVYSINRIKQQPPSEKGPELIIELNEDDSGKEDDGGIIPTQNEDLGKPVSEIDNSIEFPDYQLQDDSICSLPSENQNVHQNIDGISLSLPQNEFKIEENGMSPSNEASNTSFNLMDDNSVSCAAVTTSIASTSSYYVTFSSSEINETISSNVYFDKENLFDGSKFEENLSVPIEEYDTNLTMPSDSFRENINLDDDTKLVDSDAIYTPEEFDTRSFVEETEPEPNGSVEMEENMEIDDTNVTETNKNENLPTLEDAENNLIEIRARLLLNLDELEESIKKDTVEKEKLNKMLKKFLTLKSMIFKFEAKIRAQQSKLSNQADLLQSLFKDVALQTDSCVQLKNVCLHAGVKIKGFEYK